MIRLERIKTWFLIAVLTICGTAGFASCSSNEDNATEQSNITTLMQKGQEDLLQMVNNVIRQMKSDGSLRKLHEKYGLVYAY